MAEIAGLVIGGVGLAALFDSCMSAFEYVDSGANYGRDYNKAALQISLLQLKLARWKASVRFVEDASDPAAAAGPPGSGSFTIATPAEADQVRALLAHIEDEFSEAKLRAEKYKSAPSNEPPATDSTSIAALTTKIQNLALARQKKSSWKQKTSWALHDRVKFSRLIDDQTRYISALVELFPPNVQAQQLSLASLDVDALGGAQQAEEMEMLQYAAEAVDPVMQEAVARALAQMGGHTFGGKVSVADQARFADGDYVAKDWKGGFKQGPGDTFSGEWKLTGNGRGMRGTNYGGKHVFDD